MTELADNPKILALRADPEIQRMLEEGRLWDLLRDDRLIEAANDPELAKQVKKFDLKKALDYAAQETSDDLSRRSVSKFTSNSRRVRKCFAHARWSSARAPNEHTCPICLGLPGALPVMNHEALRMTVLTGLMLDCEIPAISKFDRKNYFYPDVAKNYQITQYDQPLCTNGRVPLHDLAYPKDAQKNIATPDKKVSLVRIHLEEDVAKSFHFETAPGSISTAPARR